MRSHEFWRDTSSGEVWAVELTDGDVTAAQGPLGAAEIDPRCLPTYAYDVAPARIQAQRERFALVTEEELLLLSAESE